MRTRASALGDYPSDGDTKGSEPRDPVVADAIVTMFVRAGFEVHVDRGPDDSDEQIDTV